MSYNYVHIVTDDDWKLFGIIPSVTKDSKEAEDSNHITFAEFSSQINSNENNFTTSQIIKGISHNNLELKSYKSSDIFGTLSNRSVFSKDNVLVGLSFT
jgi:hypothetical protein